MIRIKCALFLVKLAFFFFIEHSTIMTSCKLDNYKTSGGTEKKYKLICIYKERMTEKAHHKKSLSSTSCFSHHSKSWRLMVLPVNWELSDPLSSSANTVGSCRMCTGRSTVSWVWEHEVCELNWKAKSPSAAGSSCSSWICTNCAPVTGSRMGSSAFPAAASSPKWALELVGRAELVLFDTLIFLWGVSEAHVDKFEPFCFLLLASWMAL